MGRAHWVSPPRGFGLACTLFVLDREGDFVRTRAPAHGRFGRRCTDALAYSPLFRLDSKVGAANWQCSQGSLSPASPRRLRSWGRAVAARACSPALSVTACGGDFLGDCTGFGQVPGTPAP